jgi:hypothetical protein
VIEEYEKFSRVRERLVLNQKVWVNVTVRRNDWQTRHRGVEFFGNRAHSRIAR